MRWSARALRNPARSHGLGEPMRRVSILALACAMLAPAAAHATFPGGTGRIAMDLHGKNLDDAGQASYRAIMTMQAGQQGRQVRARVPDHRRRRADRRLRDRLPLAVLVGHRPAAGVRRRQVPGADERGRHGLSPAGAVHVGRRRARLVAIGQAARVHRAGRDLGRRPRDAPGQADRAPRLGPGLVEPQPDRLRARGQRLLGEAERARRASDRRRKDPGWAASGEVPRAGPPRRASTRCAPTARS